VAECLELVHEVAGLAVAVDAAGVVVGAQVVEAGGGVGEQVPDDHQDGAGYGDQGLTLADAPDQAAVALAEEGVGLGSGGGAWGAVIRSCSSPVLVQETTEQVTSVHPILMSLASDAKIGGWTWALQPKRPMRTMPVVMLHVDS
jgi:hypothetical protein